MNINSAIFDFYDDVINIKSKKLKNIEGVIIGKAIYDGNIDIKELSKII